VLDQTGSVSRLNADLKEEFVRIEILPRKRETGKTGKKEISKYLQASQEVRKPLLPSFRPA
jgi:hypothetical protein